MPLVPNDPCALDVMSMRFFPCAVHVPVVPHPTGAAKSTSFAVSQEFPKNSESPTQNKSDRFVRSGDPFQDKLTISSGLLALHCIWNAGVVTVRVAGSVVAPAATATHTDSDARATTQQRTRCMRFASFGFAPAEFDPECRPVCGSERTGATGPPRSSSKEVTSL